MLCENTLFLRFLHYSILAVNVIKFAIPIFLIVKLTLDIYHGIIDVNDKDIKEKIIKRIFACIVIFLIPTMVNIVLNIVEGATDMKFNYSECTVNIKNISYYEKKRKLEIKLQEDKNNQKLFEQYQLLQKELEDLKENQRTDNNAGSITIGRKYKLSESELKGLCGVAKAEQGSINGAKNEATLMANRYELLSKSSKYYGKGIYNYVRNSGWFAHAVKHMSQGCPSDFLQAVRDVLVNGNRTMPLYIDEHDCFNCNSKRCSNGNKGDICKIEVNGKTITSMSNIKTRSDKFYISGSTKVYTLYKQSSSIKYWTFYTFAKTENGTNRGDPFGYTNTAKEKIDSLNK